MDKEKFPNNYAVKKQKADLTEADLTDADLRGEDLRGAGFTWCEFD